MTTALTVDARETLYVARQPILDAAGTVFGYELLYRDLGQAGEDPREDLARARVLTDAVLTLGLEAITGGKPAFLSLSRPLLLRLAALLPPSAAVFALQRDMPVDGDTFEVCRELHGLGYALALDAFVADSDAAALLPFVKYVKVDAAASGPAQQAAVARGLTSSGISLIADNVRTPESFAAARAAGYGLFQGAWFSTPTLCGGAAVPGRQLAYLQLLSALNKPDLTLSEIEDLVKHDVSLSYRVLRCINSAGSGMRREVTSIRQALLLMGLAPIRSWASVWCVAGLNTGGVSELVTTALIRGRCCELLGERIREAEASSEMFLIGLCSMLDVMLERTMADAIGDLPLSPAARAALLGGTNLERTLLDGVIAYEQGEWEQATSTVEQLGLAGDDLAVAYTRSLRWARELTKAVG
jgi:c-di-GMP-related signal transduction protein